MESGGDDLWTDTGTYLYPTSNKPIKTRGYATEVQAATTTLNYNNGAKATRSITGSTSITITNLPDGGEGQIEITSSGNFTLGVNGSTGYTATQRMGDKDNLKPSSKTTVVYWRSGSTLYYGFIHAN